MLYGTVLGIHVCTFLAALLLFVLGELLLILARRGQSSAARMALLARSSGNLMAGIGVLAGIVLVIIGGWSLQTPWLLVSFALIAALIVVGRKVVRPWEARVRSALGSDASSTQIKAFASEQSALIGRAAVIALFAMVAGLMTMKPALALFP
jgi:uncharacterized membrane protein SirB2